MIQPKTKARETNGIAVLNTFSLCSNHTVTERKQNVETFAA